MRRRSSAFTSFNFACNRLRIVCRSTVNRPLSSSFADVREAEEVERLRFPFSAPLPVLDRKRSELQQSRFLGMQFQVELPQTLRQFRPKLLGFRLSGIPPRCRRQTSPR